MALATYTMSELNLDTCLFMKPEKFEKYHKSFINLGGNRGLILQSPKLIVTGNTEQYYDFSINKNKDRHKEFYNIISHIEDIAINQIFQNSEEWFGKKITKEQVELMFKSIINRPLDINDHYIIKMSKLPEINIQLNRPVICLISIDGVIFGKNSAILDIKIIQTKVSKSDTKENKEDKENKEIKEEEDKRSFYDDNASVINFKIESKTFDVMPVMQEIEEIEENEESEENENKENEKEVEVEELVCVDTIPEPVSEPEPVAIPESVVAIPEFVVANNKSIIEPITDYLYTSDFIKKEIVKAIINNDFVRVKELKNLLSDF